MFDDNQANEASFNIANKTLVDFLEVNTIKKKRLWVHAHSLIFRVVWLYFPIFCILF